MYRKFMRDTTIALGTLLLGSSLVMAAGVQGTVSALDGKGIATVRTSDGKDHQVNINEGWKVGAKVECDTKHNVMECHPASVQTSLAPAPATTAPSQAATKPAPAPATSAPAPSTSAPAPSTTTPAPASK